MRKKVTYKEPADYFPKDIRKACGLGEYSEKAKRENAEEKKRRSEKKHCKGKEGN